MRNILTLCFSTRSTLGLTFRLVTSAFFILSMAACSVDPAPTPIVFTGDRKDPVEHVELAPTTKKVAAPKEETGKKELTTLHNGGNALQYYALETLVTKVAFLTFDDFGSERNLNEILTVLNTYGAKATFFINCRYVDPKNSLYSPSYVLWMHRLQRDGHTIGNHTYSHLSQGTYWFNYYRDKPVVLANGKISPPPNSSAQAYTYQYGYSKGLEMLKNEIDACDNIMNSHKIPAYDPIFRPPYGEHMPVLDTALAQAGYSTTQVLNWDVNTCDYYTTTTALEIRNAMVQGKLPATCSGNANIVTRPLRNGDVINLHWSTNALNNTAEGLALALAALSSEFSFPALQNETTDY